MFRMFYERRGPQGPSVPSPLKPGAMLGARHRCHGPLSAAPNAPGPEQCPLAPPLPDLA